MRVSLTPAQRGPGNDWDVNASMGLPISMCAPYGADFDGDVMIVFCVTSVAGRAECSSFSWDHAEWSPYDEAGHQDVLPMGTVLYDAQMEYQSMCTTVCWSVVRVV